MENKFINLILELRKKKVGKSSFPLSSLITSQQPTIFYREAANLSLLNNYLINQTYAMFDVLNYMVSQSKLG